MESSYCIPKKDTAKSRLLSAKVSQFSIKRYTIEDGSNRESSIESSIRVDQEERREGGNVNVKGGRKRELGKDKEIRFCPRIFAILRREPSG